MLRRGRPRSRHRRSETHQSRSRQVKLSPRRDTNGELVPPKRRGRPPKNDGMTVKERQRLAREARNQLRARSVRTRSLRHRDASHRSDHQPEVLAVADHINLSNDEE